jgi:hypothetical protein
MRPLNTESYCFAFVCEPGELEIKSLMLAYSLKKICPSKRIVLIPYHRKQEITSKTYSLFNDLAADVCFFENPITQNTQKLKRFEPMSNKFFGLKQLDFQGHIVFLDSDIICLGTIPPHIFDFELSAKPADYSLNANWEVLYNYAGMPYPEQRVKSTFDEKTGPPYYNTGAIIIRNNLKEDLCNAWEEYFKFFSEKSILAKNLFNPYHCDQLAFALATQKLQLNINELSEPFNYPVRSRKKIPGDSIFVHYHDCITIARNDKLKNVFYEFLNTYPQFFEILRHNLEWRLLAKKYSILLNLIIKIPEIKKRLNRFINRLK